MQERKDDNPEQKHDQRNPELAVCKDGFEQSFFLSP
jgi:hypothetical protein